MVLVEAEHVVEVAADAAAQGVMDGEAAARRLRQRLRQEARLDALGQFQLLVDLLVRLLEALVDAVDLGRFLIQAVVYLLDAQQGPRLGGQLVGGEGAEQVGVGAGLVAGQAGGGAVVVGDVEDGREAVFEAAAEAATEVQRLGRGAAAVHHQQVITTKTCRVRRAGDVGVHLTAAVREDAPQFLQGVHLVGADEDARCRRRSWRVLLSTHYTPTQKPLPARSASEGFGPSPHARRTGRATNGRVVL